MPNAKEGAKIPAKVMKRFGRCVWDNTVQPYGGNQLGAWACIDCGLFFQNNVEAASHRDERPTHRMGWYTDGVIEQPTK